MLTPAFMICDKTLYLEPHLTFSLDGIKIEYLDLDSFEDEKLSALQWEISNIISISCKWTRSVSNSLYFCHYYSYFMCFIVFNTYYHPNQVGSALITLLVGSTAETGNAGIICVQDIVFQIYLFSSILMLHGIIFSTRGNPISLVA